MSRVLVALFVLLAFAPSAHAARLQAFVTDGTDPRTCGEAGCNERFEFRATYVGEPGEANRLTVTREGGVLRVADPGAAIAITGTGCRATGPGAAECDIPAQTVIARVEAELGEGDDTATVAGIVSQVDGGPGNDTLTGGDATDRLNGEAGDDGVAGGGGGDALDGGLGADTLAGGDGVDVVLYVRTEAVSVDLGDAAPDGAAGENDTITGVESAQGGSGDDVLAGDEGPNYLYGAGGRDRLTGRGDNDRLEGAGGVDTYDAGPGDDELLTADGPRSRSDVLGCGAGDDVVFVPDIGDVVLPDCEQVAPENLEPERAQPIAVRGGRIELALAQREGLGNQRATVVVKAPSGGAVVARAAFRTRRGAATTRVRAPLTAAGRRYLRRRSGKALRIDYAVRVRGGVFRTGYTVRLR